MLATFFKRTSTIGFQLTSSAANQVKNLLQGDAENKMLRIGLKDGGCAGFSYNFDFESKPKMGDHVFTNEGASVVLDDHALIFLRGATLDYKADKFSSYFRIDLPTSTQYHSCNCGKSVGTETGSHC